MVKTNWGGEKEYYDDDVVIDIIEDIYNNINALELTITEQVYNEALLMNDLGCLNRKTLDIIKFIKK